MAKRVLILAGGTGGHVYPALAVAEELRTRGCDVRWMGTPAGLEARVVPAAGIPIDWLSVTGFRGKGWLAKFKVPFKLILAIFQSVRHVRRFRPDVVLGMGGFVAGPGGLVARLFGIPLVIHEQNRIPGTTNRFLLRFAQIVLEAFSGSFPSNAKAVAVGNPLRNSIRQAAIQKAPKSSERIRILVLGGSQGAKALNEVVPHSLAKLSGSCEILHQTGEAMKLATDQVYRAAGMEAKVVSFIEDMASAYTWADIAICRAGAMTVSELAAFGLPAIFIPFPYAIDDHQTANAKFLVDQGAALILSQADLTSESLYRMLSDLIHNPERLVSMAKVSKSLAQLHAAVTVCDLTLASARA